jgi:hypothetical protein
MMATNGMHPLVRLSMRMLPTASRMAVGGVTHIFFLFLEETYYLCSLVFLMHRVEFYWKR